MALLRLDLTPLINRLHPRRLAAAALDLLLPPRCAICDTSVEQPGLLCGACFGQLTLISAPTCHVCGVPFELASDAYESDLCEACTDSPPPFERARAALVYDKASRRLLLPFKHGDRTEFALILSRLMAAPGQSLLRDADFIVPVPLHRRRLFTRRYNQAALLGFALARGPHLGASPPRVMVDALRRARPTQSLGHKSATERRDEVAGAFAVRPHRRAALTGRRVVLIDDVMTSGATIRACATALLEAGVARVDVLAAARVPAPRTLPAPPKFRRRSRFPGSAKSREPIDDS